MLVKSPTVATSLVSLAALPNALLRPVHRPESSKNLQSSLQVLHATVLRLIAALEAARASRVPEGSLLWEGPKWPNPNRVHRHSRDTRLLGASM